jgi:hypothetical protein
MQEASERGPEVVQPGGDGAAVADRSEKWRE